MIYSVLSITTRATPLSAATMMLFLYFLRFSSAKCSALVMFVCIGVGVKNSIDIVVKANAVNTIEFTCLESCHSSSGDVFFDGDGCWGNCKFGPFCSKDFSSGVNAFFKRLITHLSWIPEEVEEVTVVLKVLVVLEVILEVVVEMEMKCLIFLIWVFWYCRNVFSLLLKIMFCRFVKVGSSSFCCRDV